VNPLDSEGDRIPSISGRKGPIGLRNPMGASDSFGADSHKEVINMQMQLLFILVMALLLIVFTFQNPYPVQMRFMGWQSGQIPLIMVILISIIAGVIVSLLLGLKQAKELKRDNRQLKAELDELKAPPVKSEEES